MKSPKYIANTTPNTKSGMPGANRKVKGTIHWVSCAHCLEAEVRLYDRLWKVENPRDELAAIREAKNCDALDSHERNDQPRLLECAALLLHREVRCRHAARSPTCSSSVSVISMLTKILRQKKWYSTVL